MQLSAFRVGRIRKIAERFTIFPFYFQKRSPDTNLNYTAVFPIYGHLKQRIFRSEIDFVVWPLYVKTVRRKSASSLPSDPFLAVPYRYLQAMRGDITTYNYVYPFFHFRYGDGLNGWQFWPYGHEHKEVTTHTNVWGDWDDSRPRQDLRAGPFFANQKRQTRHHQQVRQQSSCRSTSCVRPTRCHSYGWPLV
jgi:hypothetical protein